MADARIGDSGANGTSLREYNRVLAAWQKGDLRYLLANRPSQVENHDWLLEHWGGPPIVLLCHRRYGKTMLALVFALGLALQHRNIDIALICKTKDQANQIARQAMTKLAVRAPAAYRPKRIKNEFAWLVPHTGSGIYLFGSDDEHVETIRGRTLYAALVDEPATYKGLRYKARSILLPALRDSGGQLIMMSTPSKVPQHDFEAFYREAEARGRARVVRLSDNRDPVGFTVAEALDDCGGDLLTYRREYECDFVYDPRSLVVPEATQHGLAERVRIQRQPYLDGDHYVGLDSGGRDLHALTFGTYYDRPSEDLVHIEAEYAAAGISTSDLVEVVRVTQARLWQGQGRIRRYMDPRPLLEKDLREAGVPFLITDRDNKLTHVNQVRVALAEARLTMDPSCEDLWGTLVTAKYNDTFTGYERDAQYGHADLLDSLTYLHRNVTRRPVLQEKWDPLVAEGIVSPREAQRLRRTRIQDLFLS